MEREHRLELFQASQIIYPRGDRRLGLGRTTFAAWARCGHTFGISTVLGGWGLWNGLKSKWCVAERKDKRTCFLVGGVQFYGGKYLVRCWLVRAGLSYPRYSKKVRLSLIFFTSCTSHVCSLFFTGLNSERDRNGVGRGLCEDYGVAWQGRLSLKGQGMGTGTVGWQARCRVFRVRHQRGVIGGF